MRLPETLYSLFSGELKAGVHILRHRVSIRCLTWGSCDESVSLWRFKSLVLERLLAMCWSIFEAQAPTAFLSSTCCGTTSLQRQGTAGCCQIVHPGRDQGCWPTNRFGCGLLTPWTSHRSPRLSCSPTHFRSIDSGTLVVRYCGVAFCLVWYASGVSWDYHRRGLRFCLDQGINERDIRSIPLAGKRGQPRPVGIRVIRSTRNSAHPGPPIPLPNGKSLASSSPLSLIRGSQCTAASDLPAIEHLHLALASRAMAPWLQIARQLAPAFPLLGRCVSSAQAANAWSISCAHPSRRMRPVRGQLIGEWLWSLGILMTGVPWRSRGVR